MSTFSVIVVNQDCRFFACMLAGVRQLRVELLAFRVSPVAKVTCTPGHPASSSFPLRRSPHAFSYNYDHTPFSNVYSLAGLLTLRLNSVFIPSGKTQPSFSSAKINFLLLLAPQFLSNCHGYLFAYLLSLSPVNPGRDDFVTYSFLSLVFYVMNKYWFNRSRRKLQVQLKIAPSVSKNKC